MELNYYLKTSKEAIEKDLMWCKLNTREKRFERIHTKLNMFNLIIKIKNDSIKKQKCKH